MAALAYEGNPIKAQGEKSSLPRLSQTMEGWRKEHPPTKKKFPVVTDIPIYWKIWVAKYENEAVKAFGDYALITLYYLLRVGEYTVKGKSNEKNKTVQFKL